MEILQQDVPFSNPFFVKPTIFSHPDVIKVQFRRTPTPHYYVEGTVQGVESAMCRRFTYFISRHTAELFKQVSADSRISHLSKLQQQRPPFLPDLEPIPTRDPIPSLMSLNLQKPLLMPLPQRSRTPSPNLPPISEYPDSGEWEDADDQEDPISEVHYCPQSPTPPSTPPTVSASSSKDPHQTRLLKLYP
jgi:hypothetical protein